MTTTPHARVPHVTDANYSELYKYHVGKAADYEEQATKRAAHVKASRRKTHPHASSEWIETQASEDHYFKSHVSNQQFHTREATKYGLGMLQETLAVVINDLRYFNASK